MSRQQANPRARIIELLGDYGAKAKAAVPTLQQNLASDKNPEKSLHDAARKALAEMGVEGQAESESKRE